jgi:hypothetical protein
VVFAYHEDPILTLQAALAFTLWFFLLSFALLWMIAPHYRELQRDEASSACRSPAVPDSDP